MTRERRAGLRVRLAGVYQFAVDQRGTHIAHYQLVALESRGDLDADAIGDPGRHRDLHQLSLQHFEDELAGLAEVCHRAARYLDGVGMTHQVELHVRIHARVEAMPGILDVDFGEHGARREIQRGGEALNAARKSFARKRAQLERHRHSDFYQPRFPLRHVNVNPELVDVRFTEHRAAAGQMTAGAFGRARAHRYATARDGEVAA